MTKRVLSTVLGVFMIIIATLCTPAYVHADSTMEMYRLFNRNNGEHFYTRHTNERDSLINSGWTYEGVAFMFANNGAEVYRLYNGKEHLYTQNPMERDSCISSGWIYEGIALYSNGSVPVYRLFNKTNGMHHYTTDENEKNVLSYSGWNYEGIVFYVLSTGHSNVPVQQVQNNTVQNTQQTQTNNTSSRSMNPADIEAFINEELYYLSNGINPYKERKDEITEMGAGLSNVIASAIMDIRIDTYNKALAEGNSIDVYYTTLDGYDISVDIINKRLCYIPANQEGTLNPDGSLSRTIVKETTLDGKVIYEMIDGVCVWY